MTSNFPPNDLESRLIASAELEEPPPDLGARTVAEVARRQELLALTHPSSRKRAWFWPGLAAGVMVGAAASLALTWHRPPVTVKPEPSSVAFSPLGESSGRPAGQPSAPPAPSAKPAVDPCAAGIRATGKYPLIDDFEDGDDAIFSVEGRKALWRWSRDTDLAGTAPALLPMPRPGATKANRQAIHIKGGILRDWGATIEMKFESLCYDASAYAGLSFMARGPGRIYVAPREVEVIERAFGGTCDKDCYNAHVRKIDLGPTWQTYEIRWAEVEQRGYNRPPLDPRRLHDIAFLVRPEDTPYDVWLDELRFLPK